MKTFFAIMLGLLSLIYDFGFTQSGLLDTLNIPKIEQYVTDYSNTLTQQQISELDVIASDYEKKTNNQIVTLLFPNRNGNELLDIGLKLFRENGIGQKDKNNGLLLLISTEEKKIRIIVGYGLEGYIPDLLASDIIEKDIRPFVNSGDFYGAVKNFYSRVESSIQNEEGKDYVNQSSEDDSLSGLLFFGFLLIIIIWIFYFGKNGGNGPYSSGGVPFPIGDWSGGSSSSGSSGGFSGGGGSSGGGGAGD